MRGGVLSDRALNRATIARQLLLERAPMGDLDAVAALVGLQAQTTRSWYLTLWSRLGPYDPAATGELLATRRLVRMTAMRGTIHLVTADDAPVLRAFTQPAIARLLRGTFGRQLVGVDLDELVRVVQEVVGDGVTPLDTITDALAARWPSADRFALAQAGRGLVPFVHAPPRGVWGRSGGVRLALLERWLGRPVPGDADPAAMLRRYLAAYGPASVADAQAWSGRTGLAPAFERLRPELITFRDTRGRELFDVPEAPRPDAGTPVPVRFLADYDNVLLSHADRSRFIGEAERKALTSVSGPIPGTVLVDGTVAASWFIRRDGHAATVVVTVVAPIGAEDEAGIAAEAERVVAFLQPRAGDRRVEFRR
jgi:hypothetical protein